MKLYSGKKRLPKGRHRVFAWLPLLAWEKDEHGRQVWIWLEWAEREYVDSYGRIYPLWPANQ